MDLQLTVEEAGALHDLLAQYLKDMYGEIAHTDNPAFRRGLRDRRDALQRVLDRLAAVTAE